jgi:outer membrane protein
MSSCKSLVIALATPLLLASGFTHAAAGDIVVTAGLVNIDNSRSSSTPQQNQLSRSIATQTKIVPMNFSSPGTEETIGDAVKPILTMSYFLDSHWAVTAVGGIPPKLDVIGHGAVTTPGILNPIVPAVNMGLAANNPVATVKHWFPSVMIQYHFGDSADNLRPYLGAGIGYSFFTNVQLMPNFDKNLRQAGAFLALATTLDPNTSTEAEASSAFRPLVNAGLSYRLDKTWSACLSVAYVPIKTTSTIRVRDKTGTVVLTSQADLKIPTVATSATVGYHF